MHILVTRPEPDASRLAAQLAAAGHVVTIAPIMQVIFEEATPISLDGVQAVLITSANGARALARCEPRRDIKVLAVGDASARQLRDDGFADVTSAGGDVTSLVALAQRTCRPENGPLLHVAGADIAGDLAGQLSAAGYEVARQVLYCTTLAEALPEAAEQAIAAGKADAVMLFSPRTAKAFADLAKKAQLEDACASLTLLCLSDAVAQAASSLGWGSVIVAAAPTMDAMLALLD